MVVLKIKQQNDGTHKQHARLGQASLRDWNDIESDSQRCLAFTYSLQKATEHLFG